jgi:ankyrin repeat protein
MSFYPRLFEASKKVDADRLYNKGAGNVFLLKELEKKFPDKYHFKTGKRIENRSKVSTDDLIKDVKTIISDHDLNADASLIKTLPPGKATGGISDKYPTLCFTLDDKQYKVKFSGALSGEKLSGTSTIFKEGMVVYFFNTKETYSAFSKRSQEKENGYFELIEKIQEDIEQNKIEGLEESDITKILDSLKGESNVFNLDFLNSIFTAMSIGNKLKEQFPDFEICRDKFFSEIKSEAASNLGFKSTFSDKWNPMDILLIKSGKKQELLDIWEEAKEEENHELKLGKYNSVFLDELNSKNEKSIALAISLKEERARGGKGKSYLDSIETLREKYNLTKEEISWSKAKLLSKIVEIRREIEPLLEENEISDIFKYAVEDPITGFNKSLSVRSKYGCMKMLKYLLEKTTLKNNVFVDLAAYSLSLGKNPTFFKYVGNKDGDISKVKITKFEEKGGVLLYDIKANVVDDYDGKIMIRDSNSNAGIEINYYIVVASIVYAIKLIIRTAGSTQVFIEIEKIKEIKDLTESFYPRLFEKFEEESDPIHDLRIGITLKKIREWAKISLQKNNWRHEYAGDINELLWFSAAEGKIDFVEYLLENGADIHYKRDYALRWACYKGHIEVVKFLLDSGADVHAFREDPLRNAKQQGHNKIVEILKDHIKKQKLKESLNEKFEEESDPIHDLGIGIHYVIREWAKSIIEKEGWTESYVDSINDLLWISAAYGKINFIKYLLSKGADIHCKYDYPLRWACIRGQIEAVKFFLDAGVNPNTYTSDIIHDTPIHYAKKYHHDDIIKILKEYGAIDIDITESLNEKFEEKGDPIKDMGIGFYRKHEFETRNELNMWIVKNLALILEEETIPEDIISQNRCWIRIKYFEKMEDFSNKYLIYSKGRNYLNPVTIGQTLLKMGYNPKNNEFYK